MSHLPDAIYAEIVMSTAGNTLVIATSGSAFGNVQKTYSYSYSYLLINLQEIPGIPSNSTLPVNPDTIETMSVSGLSIVLSDSWKNLYKSRKFVIGVRRSLGGVL